MKKSFYIFSTFILVLVSCEVSGVKKTNHTDDSDSVLDTNQTATLDSKKTIQDSTKRVVKQLESGVRIVWTKKNDSLPKLVKGDVVRIKQEGRLSDGKLVESWKQIGRAPAVCLGYGMIVKGLEEAAYQMSPGDIAKIFVPSELGYNRQGLGDLQYELEIVRKEKPMKLDSGVELYRVEKVKTNVVPDHKGKELSFDYQAFVEGKGLYDNSYKKQEPFQFKQGTPLVVPGLNEALLHIRENDKAYVKIPAEMAYGKKGLVDLVPSNTPILYDIMNLKVVK